jgi:oxygen-dependent protoporphyrinogen oxidase
MLLESDSIPAIGVIAGGVAGLATAVNLLEGAKGAGVELRVTVFEKGAHAGGNLQTVCRDGWQVEKGPNGFLDNEPATLRLVDRLGLREKLVRSSDAARRRFLLVGGRIQQIPDSPLAFLRTRLLSVGAKVRIAGELLVPARKDLGRAAEDPGTDETIAQFGNRRLGRAFTETMLDPMVKGIFGGDARRLSLAATFPRMIELEKDYGGLLRAMIRLTRERKKRVDAGPTGTLYSFAGGMATLVAALTRVLVDDPRARLLTSTDVQTIRLHEGCLQITAGDRIHGPFAAVVEAAPAHAAAGHLGALDSGLGERLGQIPFAPMVVIALGFPRAEVTHDLDGFGMLIPSSEKKMLLGALWTSSIFPGRAPAGQVLIRCMAGGAANPQILDLDDAAILETVLDELRPHLGLRGAPSMIELIRHERAIAQYEPGHLARLREIDRSAHSLPGLFLTGSSYRGISVNACIKEAEQVARDVLDKVGGCPR